MTAPNNDKVPRTRHPRGTARNVILTSARELFSDLGYANTSTRAIAERADVVEALLYRHFGSKAGLFMESMLEPFASFFGSFDGTLPERIRVLDPQHGVALFITELYDIAVANRGALLALISAAEFDSSALGELDDAFTISEAIDILHDVTQRKLEEMGLRADDTDVTLRAIFAMVVGMALFESWIMPPAPRRPSRSRIIEELVALSLHGSLPADAFAKATGQHARSKPSAAKRPRKG